MARYIYEDTLVEILADMKGENLTTNRIGIFGCSENHINFEVGGKEYVLTLHEVKEGEHWSEYLGNVKRGEWLVTGAYPHHVYCSNCFTTFADEKWVVWKDGSLPRKYCPNCGSQMGVEQDG